jgi:hypothetical protein
MQHDLYSHYGYRVISGSFIITAACTYSIPSGVPYPIHPLDLTTVVDDEGIQDDNGNNVTVCTAAIEASPGDSELDAIFGDIIMRNIYSVSVSSRLHSSTVPY